MHFSSIISSLFHNEISRDLTITSNNGFHLRPVAKFVSSAKTFSSEIQISFNGKRVNAKAVNSILGLSLEQDDTFTLICKGKDSKKALDELSTTFNTLMQDDVQIDIIEKESSSYRSPTIPAEIISSGIAIAKVYHHKEIEKITHSTLSFDEAFSKSSDELEDLYKSNIEKSNSDIYLAQKELLSSLKDEAHDVKSLQENIEHASKQLLGTKLEAKISDYKDILSRVKKHLGVQKESLFPNEEFILLADDLLPSQIENLSKSLVQGVILKSTSLNSHTSILLRSLGITSLIANTDNIEEGTLVILDAHAAVVVLNPSKEELEKANKRQVTDKKLQTLQSKKRFEKAITSKGKPIKVLANVTDLNSANIAKEEGAEGIGLLRTEFLFKEEKPSYEMQVKAYGEIFDVYDEITVRTLDVGGDKALPYIKLIQEENPFLGIRGVRLLNTHPDIIEEQLHAIFTASKGKTIKVMFPMVSSVEEFVEAKNFSKNVAKKYNIDISNILFGIMIEVPSVLFLLESFNKIVDFYSIGTNDLTQYLFAIERTHTTLKTNDLSPAVFDAIKLISNKTTKPLSICGELAANKDAIPTLLEIGIDTLSVSAKNIPQTKEIIRNV
ncbi:Phosphoenolpyruvate-protein phosphotransferase of PTS system / Fructose-specific phosphocarrier protein HPr / PTS system, fructose-specific IIA component [hydrothermal vent metagenome]|uniref:Phosphoenolpyruvate-protein phosphotransferase of PTS system / Fructose-specific phosphocarrier protein HPr / PTS system, fructose-specific IIA component n=1 Tax=hydrothermal vent metagenome TaxID=652676 RepID=A0A1W1EBU7_9ZZZZ